MWLIDTSSLQLKEFQTCPIEQYAILSHRWQEREVTFEEFRVQSSNLPTSRPAGRQQQQGLQKVRQFCLQTRVRGLKYAWVDTCCIDKRSSAELTESINSMFKWYANAKECYVYMSDVDLNNTEALSVPEPVIDSLTDLLKAFPATQKPIQRPDIKPKLHRSRLPEDFDRSSWFRRGWTLQELIAPSHALFFDTHWTYMGDKRNLACRISQATGIDEDLLLAKRALAEYSVAQRMSWAAHRMTTRPEDIAYCLLGIFDVNMPLLYGEGKKAFLRLQEAIIQSSDDESIFAWTGIQPGSSGGLLAPEPQAFSQAQHVEQVRSQSGQSSYSMTNKGLAIERDLIPVEVNTYFMPLQCEMKCPDRYDVGMLLGLYLCRTEVDNLYQRVCYQTYPLGFQTKALTQDQELIYDIFMRSRTCNGSCPSICREVLVQQSRPVALYVPQTYKGYLPPRGPFRLHLSQRAIDSRPPFDTSYYHHGPLLERDAFIGTNARTESGVEGSTLTIYGDEMNEGININLFGYGLEVQQLQLGFDFDFRPICVVLLSPSSNGDTSHLGEFLREKGFYDFRSDTSETMSSGGRYPNIRTLVGDRLTGLHRVVGAVGRQIRVTVEFVPSASNPMQWELSIVGSPLFTPFERAKRRKAGSIVFV